MKGLWSKLQSAPVLFLLTVWSFSIFGCKEHNQSDFGNDHLVMSKAKFACYSRYLLTSYFFILAPCNGQGGLACCDSWGHKESDTTEKLNWTEWKGHLFWVLVLEELIGHHRTIQLQLLQHYWLRHILGLLWYWMVCLGNDLRAFRHFCDCTQVLHFRLLLTMMATPFLLRDSCPQ